MGIFWVLHIASEVGQSVRLGFMENCSNMLSCLKQRGVSTTAVLSYGVH